MLSLESTSRTIAASIYYADELYNSEESFETFLLRRLPNFNAAEAKYFQHISKERLIFDYAFRTKNNVEYQLLVQRDYILFSRYKIIKFFGDEKKAYCSLSAFFTRDQFSTLDEYVNFVRGSCKISNLGVGGGSLIRWMLKHFKSGGLSVLERQIICYELMQLAAYCQIQLPIELLLNALQIESLILTTQVSYNEALQDICDAGFLLWKSYFKSKPHCFYHYGEILVETY